MHKPTTTTRPRKRPPVQPAAPAATLTRDELQRIALAGAEAAGWGVEVEAGDGTRARLRLGHPARALVITLSPVAGAEPAELYP